jgi:hypothetical protein
MGFRCRYALRLGNGAVDIQAFEDQGGRLNGLLNCTRVWVGSDYCLSFLVDYGNSAILYPCWSLVHVLMKFTLYYAMLKHRVVVLACEGL